MRNWLRWVLFLLIVIYYPVLYGTSVSSTESPWYNINQSGEVEINVNMYLSTECPHCKNAHKFFRAELWLNPWIHVHTYWINTNKDDLNKFYNQLHLLGLSDFTVPSIFFCNSNWKGFDSFTTTGANLLKALNYCRSQIKEHGKLRPLTEKVLQQWSGSNSVLFQTNLHSNQYSDLWKIASVAITDAFSPCSLSVFLIFFSFLWVCSKKRKNQFITGLILIGIIGLMHLFQYSEAQFYFEFKVFLPYISRMIGLLLLVYSYLYFRQDPLQYDVKRLSLAISLMGLSMLTIYANQQSCIYGVGSLFENWVQTQRITFAAYYFYEMTFLFFYLIPMLILLLLFLWVEKFLGLIFPIAAHWIILFTGLILLISPLLLSIPWVSCVILILSFLSAWVMVRMYKR